AVFIKNINNSCLKTILLRVLLPDNHFLYNSLRIFDPCRIFAFFMNLDVLLNEYRNDPRCFQIADKITLSQPQRIYLKGLAGSASQFIVSAAFSHPSTAGINHLVVLRDAEEAAYFHNTLEN